MHLRRTLTAALLGASLVVAAPSVASAHGQGHGQRGGNQGSSAQSYDRSNVPSRVSTRLARAERSLARAADAVDESNAAATASALKSVRSNLAAAVKSAKKRSAADNGPDSFYAVATTQHNVVDQVASLYDGADDTTVSALTQTLNAAIDSRDDLVATIAGLTADQQSGYGFVLSAIDDDVTSEIDSIDEALADDTLTDAAKADLTAARAKLVATQTAVQGLNATQSNSSTSTGTTAADGRDCPPGSRGSRGQNGSSSGSSTQEAPQT
jgi:hypothetical protein